MRQRSQEISVASNGQTLIDITKQVADIVRAADVDTGLATVFIPHTSASLVIQENADPDVQRDLLAFFNRHVRDGDPLFLHTMEGPDDMPAHVKAALTNVSLGIPVVGGRMALGTWQGIYLFEHRRAPHTRRVVVHVLGA